MNREWGRINEGAIEYAPDTFHDGDTYIVAPSPADYRQHDYLPNVDEPPKEPPPYGYHWEAGQWHEVEGRNVLQYLAVQDPPPPPRVFRKSWLAQWIYAHGKWPAFQTFLASPDAQGIAFLWSVCTEFDEDAEQWPAALAAIKAALALTDAEAEAMLAFGATGGQP